MGWCLALFALAVLQLSSGAGDYQLPADVTPSHYDVKLAYDLDPATNYSYFGVVDIMLVANKPTSKIVLHAQDYSIVNEKIALKGQNHQYRVMGVHLNDTYNFLTLDLDRPLKEDSIYKLTVPFYGNLQIGLDGVYISSYVNKKSKKTEYLIATQFEATSARKGFPCFDEPIYKSTFSINIGHNKQFTAVSNMPLEASSNENSLEDYWPWEVMRKSFKKDSSDFVWDQFEKSVPMSTYLVAFVVSSFSYVDSPRELSKAKFKIWARDDAIDQTEYAATIGPKVLTYFEKFFDVPFPLPKQDMFAIPDFSAGAMENWGLITYRETALLYDKDQSSFVNKERVAEVIAHELAHQWFGNLVTMKWWSDLWLNEGFATFMASVGTDEVEPSWSARQSHAVSNAMTVLTLDSLESSHPVSVAIDNPSRISEIFDAISYLKGAALIRMMTMFLGEDVFRQALHNYLIKYSYKNAEQDDLWAELTRATQQHGGLTRNVTVKQVMDTWTKQTGYPILTVSRDYGDQSLTISQKRYLSLGTGSTLSSWWVPLSVLCQGEPEPQTVQWLADDEGVDQEYRYEHGAAPDQWLIFNYDMIAPYRVNYDERNWKLLTAGLRRDSGTVPVLARVQLLLATYLQNESEYLPLSTGLGALSKIGHVLKRSPHYGAYQKYVRKLIRKAYEKVGGLAVKEIVNGDDLNSVKLQVLMSDAACAAKLPGAEENAIELFQEWMNYPPGPALDGVLRGREAWVGARVALRPGAPAPRQLGRRARPPAASTSLLAGRLDTVSRSGGRTLRQFWQPSPRRRSATILNHGRRLGTIIKILLDQFTTQKDLDEWSEENSKYLEEARLSVSQGVEKARVNIAWLERNKALVLTKLREYAAG
ncbi:unnamed protein product [Leptidea sinapis]|uniref:Aminopeptidase n=2 Tax=Leptidea sinapis TaxID=189913 RepID=A0A5E4PQ77_9NEOP|nr:unnamed protein product [Leptidea sinapis]